jgi:hypothetical protein
MHFLWLDQITIIPLWRLSHYFEYPFSVRHGVNLFLIRLNKLHLHDMYSVDRS